jgi:uncharacterized membrane protein YgcG
MTTTTRQTPTTRLLLAAVLGACALAGAGLAGVGTGSAAAATSASLQATDKCWLAVVNDWLDNNQVDQTYAIPCYTQAIQHLNQFPDVKGYSSAVDDIHNALLAAIRQDRGSGGSSGGLGGPGGGSSGGGSSGGPNTGPGGGGPLGTGIQKLGPTNAQSIPLPLLVLGGLAVLLLLSAGGTWLARRIQARRMTPAPAPVRRS